MRSLCAGAMMPGMSFCRPTSGQPRSGEKMNGDVVRYGTVLMTSRDIPDDLTLAFQRQRRNFMRRLVCLLLLPLLSVGILSCADRPNQSSDRPRQTPQAEESRSDTAKIDAPGLHNVYRITDNLVSGSSPEGDEGFR